MIADFPRDSALLLSRAMKSLAVSFLFALIAFASALTAAELAGEKQPASSGDFAGAFATAPALALDYSPPVATPVETLLKAIEAKSVALAVMPGTATKSLEDRLVVELAREVRRLRAETDALRAELDRIKAR